MTPLEKTYFMENLKLDFQFGLEAGQMLESVKSGQKPEKLSGLQSQVEKAFRFNRNHPKNI